MNSLVKTARYFSIAIIGCAFAFECMTTWENYVTKQQNEKCFPKGVIRRFGIFLLIPLSNKLYSITKRRLHNPASPINRFSYNALSRNPKKRANYCIILISVTQMRVWRQLKDCNIIYLNHSLLRSLQILIIFSSRNNRLLSVLDFGSYKGDKCEK